MEPKQLQPPNETHVNIVGFKATLNTPALVISLLLIGAAIVISFLSAHRCSNRR